MKRTVISAYNLASGNTNFDIKLPGMPRYGIQAVWANVTGTVNGTIKVKQSIDGTNFDQLKALDSDGAETDFGITMSGASGSASLEDKLGLTGETMRIAVTVNSITGGSLSIYLYTN